MQYAEFFLLTSRENAVEWHFFKLNKNFCFEFQRMSALPCLDQSGSFHFAIYAFIKNIGKSLKKTYNE